MREQQSVENDSKDCITCITCPTKGERARVSSGVRFYKNKIDIQNYGNYRSIIIKQRAPTYTKIMQGMY